MRIGVPKETYATERRVALVPAAVAPLKKAGADVLVESGAGVGSGVSDQAYAEAGATIVATRADLIKNADILVQVRGLGANPEGWKADLEAMHQDQLLVAVMDALASPEPLKDAMTKGITAFALDMVPRISRAQAMDVLSSQANLAGYCAVLLGASSLPKIMPMLMTAAGTITPAKVLVMGAGVAGLQAIATARRLGAVVSGYDVRPAAKEQIESLGARAVELAIPTEQSQDAGGYAKAMDAAFYAKQAELLTQVVSESDIVITTAAVPGQKAPVLVTTAMVERMQPGSVVVDIAAERGGNCELTVPGQSILHNGVMVIGPLNLASTVPVHASRLFSKNISTFLLNMIKKGELQIDLEDEIIRETMLTHKCAITNARVGERLGIALPAAQAQKEN
jgi:NAD(P) transhydrogenase subunit alpha